MIIKSRLLGGDPELVLHGGNTSEPAGLPAVRLPALKDS
jgi:rhamnose utilization protein RhaD (predicted bifunctional aldolase and dehydrogenase)